VGAPETLKLLAFSMEKEKLENAFHHTIEKKKPQKVHRVSKSKLFATSSHLHSQALAFSVIMNKLLPH
jgi:hypothetical protein